MSHADRYGTFNWSPSEITILIEFASKDGSTIISRKATLKLTSNLAFLLPLFEPIHRVGVT